MVKITEVLIRKKSEHNDCIIGTLEELSLHQENIEKIEHIQNWCKDLQILYLQSNLISKIENLNKLKKLVYLNLAINNIEKIENLHGCESLEKLDLTLNFIGDLKSVSQLSTNFNLKHLYLTGNPCCDFSNYREYIAATLPQLLTLDSHDITRSDRIRACQQFENSIIGHVETAEKEYRRFREAQIERNETNRIRSLNDTEFWQSTSENSPETRIEIARRVQKNKQIDKEDKGGCKRDDGKGKIVALFAKDGRPLNVNQAKIGFNFSDANPELYKLDVAIYKHLDTNLINVDLQPIFARITIKGKIFQIVFPAEIVVENSTAKRSQTTGHLLLEMPLVNYNKNFKQSKKIEKNLIEKIKFLEVEKEENIVLNISDEEKPEIPPLEYGFYT